MHDQRANPATGGVKKPTQDERQAPGAEDEHKMENDTPGPTTGTTERKGTTPPTTERTGTKEGNTRADTGKPRPQRPDTTRDQPSDRNQLNTNGGNRSERGNTNNAGPPATDRDDTSHHDQPHDAPDTNTGRDAGQMTRQAGNEATTEATPGATGNSEQHWPRETETWTAPEAAGPDTPETDADTGNDRATRTAE